MKSSDSGMPDTPGALEFVCNLCGQVNQAPAEALDREVASCTGCGSTVRLRALIALLSQEVLGANLVLRDFPRMKGLRALGMSDPPRLEELLHEKFDYTNTFYHKEPSFDIVKMDQRDFGTFDFIISSEVLEHVPPPVDQAFATLHRMLKPSGVLLLTVPYTLNAATQEHFPKLHDYSLSELSDRIVLVNRTEQGELQIFDDLVFHGGGGSTLEMRRFSERALRRALVQAGFQSTRIYGENYPPYGITHKQSWSLPMVARKGPFTLDRGATTELSEQYRQLHAYVRLLERELEQHKALTARLQVEFENELIDRTNWVRDLERQLAERTEWALKLQQDLDHHLDIAKHFQTEASEKTKWALSLQSDLDDLRSEFLRLKASRWTKLGRLLRLVR